MEQRHEINASFYCLHNRKDGRVRILNTGAYHVAEYNESTGELKWHRVVAAEHKKSVEHWLQRWLPPTNN